MWVSCFFLPWRLRIKTHHLIHLYSSFNHTFCKHLFLFLDGGYFSTILCWFATQQHESAVSIYVSFPPYSFLSTVPYPSLIGCADCSGIKNQPDGIGDAGDMSSSPEWGKIPWNMNGKILSVLTWRIHGERSLAGHIVHRVIQIRTWLSDWTPTGHHRVTDLPVLYSWFLLNTYFMHGSV